MGRQGLGGGSGGWHRPRKPWFQLQQGAGLSGLRLGPRCWFGVGSWGPQLGRVFVAWGLDPAGLKWAMLRGREGRISEWQSREASEGP